MLILTSCQSATGDCLAALEALRDNIRRDTTNAVGRAASGIKNKLMLNPSLILHCLGISAQQGIHKNQLKTCSQNQACDFTQCPDIKCSCQKAKKVLLLNSDQVKAGQRCWKRTKGFKEKKNPKPPLFFLETASMYFTPKVRNCSLHHPTAQPRGFQEAKV